MSSRLITKQCIHCRRTFTYNPSVGDFGMVCKHCRKPQSVTASKISSRQNKSVYNRFGMNKTV